MVVGGLGRLRPAGRRAAAVACRLGVPAARRADVELAVHEVLANAREHGHGGDGSLPIDVEVERVHDREVVVRVSDRAVHAGPRIEREGGYGIEREGGYGRELVRALTDAVDEQRRPGETTLTLRWSTGCERPGTPVDDRAPHRPAPAVEASWPG